MGGYAARGTILFNGITLTKESGFGGTGCTSLFNAKMNVIKGLANKLRARTEGVEAWTYWPDLSDEERQGWLERVVDSLQWDELQDGREARLGHIDAYGFQAALQGAWA